MHCAARACAIGESGCSMNMYNVTLVRDGDLTSTVLHIWAESLRYARLQVMASMLPRGWRIDDSSDDYSDEAAEYDDYHNIVIC